MIDIRNLGIKFGNTVLYSDFNLEISDKSHVAIMGKSGCGKSILLKAIMGYLDFSGIINVTGIKRMVHQDFDIMPWLTLRENIILSGCSNDQLEDVAERLSISKFLDYFPNRVSIGTNQRAAIARVLSGKSDIVLFDEPLSAVDEITARAIRKRIISECRNKTTVFVTHDANEALEVADRLVILNDCGAIAADLATNNLSKEEIYDIIDNGRAD